MTRQTQHYPRELRERAVRMVAEVTPNHDSQWAAINAAAQKLGVGTVETVRKWVRQAEVDAGQRAGTKTEESAELKRLKGGERRASPERDLEGGLTDRILIFDERHMRTVLARYGAHYNGRRPHRALQLLPPRPDRPTPDLNHQRIRRRTILGGLLREYERAA
jgi:transposase